MEHFPAPELSRLYRILDREVGNVRLAPAKDLHMVPLYKENRARTDDQEEIFDPIGLAPLNRAMGFWCFTRLYYDERRQAIRRVPVGGGSWNRRKKYRTHKSEGERWRKRKFTYNRFTMIEYSLGGEEDQPEYAICQISRKDEGAARDTPPNRGQRDLHQNQVVPPGNSTRPGDIADERNYIPPGHLNAPTETETVVAAAPQGPPLHDNLSNKRKLVIRDTSDGSEWTTEDDAIIRLFKMLKSFQGQSTREIRQQYVEPLDMGIEDNQSTMPFQVPPRGGADPNYNVMLQDPNLSDQLYGMANQSNAHIIGPSYAFGESSTNYNQGFGNDDVWTSDPNIYGEASNNLFQENFTLQGGVADESNYILPGHPDAPTNMTAVVAPAPQGLLSHDNSNNRRKVQGTKNLESSTAYNLGFSDDDTHTSGPQV